jgi:hypothetical protein
MRGSHEGEAESTARSTVLRRPEKTEEAQAA